MVMKEKWIWIDGKNEEDVYGEFKSAFTWKGGKTVVRVSADSEYALFINGKFVYAGQYADFPWYKIHDEIDVTEFLTRGDNFCTVWVWRGGDVNFCHYVNRAAVRFSVICEGVTVAVSDKNTLSRRLPHFKCGLKKFITFQIGYGFSIDYTLPAEEFSLSEELSDMPEKTVLRPIPTLKILPAKKAEKIGENLYDLGCETVGIPYIKCVIPKGKTVTVSFGEWLKDGKVPRIIESRDFSFTVTGNGEKVNAVNYLRKLGCRYFETEGDCAIEEIGLIPIEYPFKEKPVAVGGEKRKAIYDTAVKTLKLNAFEHYFDCPWREQGFYALDSRMQMRYGYACFNNNEYQYAALKLMSEDRNADGLVSIVVPTSHKLVIPSFALFYVVAMEEYAAETGDKRLIREYYDKLCGITQKFADNSENGLCKVFRGENFWNFYEWNEGLGGEIGGANDKPFSATLNLNFVLGLQSMARICEMLDRKRDGDNYLALAESLKKRINEEFFDAETGLYKSDNEGGGFYELVNAYAVLTGTAKGESAEKICDALVKGDGALVPCTLSMLAFKYDALLSVSKEKYGDYIIRDIDEKYGYMLSCGATSFWETLKGHEDFNGAGSLCHGWSALPVYYYRILNVAK